MNNNWCLKVTTDNIEFINNKRYGGCSLKGYINYFLNHDRENFWNWSSDFPRQCVEITLQEFKRYILEDNTLPERWCCKLNENNIAYLNQFLHDHKESYNRYESNWGFKKVDLDTTYYFHFPEATIGDGFGKLIIQPSHQLISTQKFLNKYFKNTSYPTNLNTVKFNSEPDKCIGKQPKHVYMGSYDSNIKDLSDAVRIMGNTQKAVEEFQAKQVEFDKNASNFKYWYGTENKMDNYATTVNIEWDSYETGILATKKCLPDLIYIKKLKTFLK